MQFLQFLASCMHSLELNSNAFRYDSIFPDFGEILAADLPPI